MATQTTYFSFDKPTVGGDENTWGGFLNGNWDTIDTLLGAGTQTITVGSVVVDNITIDGNAITSTSGNIEITPVAGSNITLDGTITIDAGVVAGATSITSTTFTGDLTGTADNSTNINQTSTDGNGGDQTCFPALFVSAGVGQKPLHIDQAGFTYNANTNVLGVEGGMRFTGQTDASGTGITSGADTLDHYEEGTWTPTFENDTRTGLATITNVNGSGTAYGSYTRVGRMVYVRCKFKITADNTMSNSDVVRVYGLPFTAENDSVGPQSQSLFTLGYGTGWTRDSSTYPELRVYAAGTGSFIEFSQGANAGINTAVTYQTSGGGATSNQIFKIDSVINFSGVYETDL